MEDKYDFKPGQKIDDYVLVAGLGAGQDGEVWLVEKRSLGKSFAIKFLNSSEAEKVRRFEREVQILASLNHPHVITVFDKGEAWNPATGALVPYYVMEFLQAKPLDIALRTLPTPEVFQASCSLFQQVTRALSAIHDKGVTHGDIKAANVMVMPRERIAKLTDFGFGFLPGEEVVGRAEYASSSYRVPAWLTRKEADIHRLGQMFTDCVAQLRSRFSPDEFTDLQHAVWPLVDRPAESLLESLAHALEGLKYRSVGTWSLLSSLLRRKSSRPPRG